MGRPREHDENTATALLDAAESILGDGGPGALSVRGVSDRIGTSTRAVYSLFGSKEGLLVGLGVRGYNVLAELVDAVPTTADPGADLVEAGVMGFRRFVLEHPVLFEMAFRRYLVMGAWQGELQAAGQASLARLRGLVRRLEAAGRLGSRSVDSAVMEFHALCDGLADNELRGILPRGDEEGTWRDALTALVAGFRAT
jgi:AcrR family transcriptional regulator